MRKTYVLDTNILLHDPGSMFNFGDNAVIIPVGVIEEIDRFKKEMSDRGFNARNVARSLDGMRGGGQLIRGVELPGGGTLRVHCGASTEDAHADREILNVAAEIRDTESESRVVIVTKDINLRIRADVLGLQAADYETDHVRLTDLPSADTEIEVDADALAVLRQEGRLQLEGAPTQPNSYVLLRDRERPRSTALARVTSEADGLAVLQVPESICGLRPLNKEQYYAIDALLDDNIRLVTLLGRAGTGKTLLAMAGALHASLHEGRYRGVLAARPVVPLGRDLGYLPGQIESKLEPWMKPISDTVEFLVATGGPLKGCKDPARLLGDGVIEIQPLTYIRGRSITARYLVIDEAQNLTPLEAKTIITRLGHDAKIVLTGDPEQIDNPYVDAQSNGFSYVVNRFRTQPIAAHVVLRKGERSPLAELAATLL